MKKFFPLALLLLCAAWAPAASAQEGRGRGDAYYRDGARLALEGRLAEAARAFEQTVALDPSNGNAFYALGNVYAELGRWGDAVNAYYKAVSLNKEDVEALNNLGVALRMRGLHRQAASAFERAIKLYPKWAEPHYHLSEARRALGEEEEAREAYKRALRLRPDYAARPPRPFANARAKSQPAPATPGGRILRAMDAVGVGAAPERVASSTPPAPGTPRDAGTSPANTPPADTSPANTNTRPRAAAEGASAPPPPARPAPAEATLSPYDLGLREARAGRQRAAVAAFRQAVLLDRRNAAAHRALGDAYAALGEWREAVDAYEQAARLAPGDAETYQKLGRSYAKLRETGAAAGEADAAPSTSAADASDSNAAGAAPSDADPTAVYRIGPGDVLDVRLLRGAEPRTTSYKVTPTGLLDYPALRAPLTVAGLTPEEAAARLGAALKLRGAAPGAEVAVGVREYVSHAVIVGGMVKEPGTKILQREAVPLYVVVAHAQPLAGAGEAVVVSRATGKTVTADLTDAAAMKALVRPGDVVTLRALPKRFVYVAGAVREPGQKEFHSGMTLTQAVLAAGGALGAGAREVAVTRQAQDGRLSTERHSLLEIRGGRAPDPALRPGDRVEVLK
jgi:tetratricopeptide (TPR) repeat protein